MYIQKLKSRVTELRPVCVSLKNTKKRSQQCENWHFKGLTANLLQSYVQLQRKKHSNAIISHPLQPVLSYLVFMWPIIVFDFCTKMKTIQTWYFFTLEPNVLCIIIIFVYLQVERNSHQSLQQVLHQVDYNAFAACYEYIAGFHKVPILF